MAGCAQRVAVVGAGWAGLAAAVQATRRGARVSLFEMAGEPGGRARQVGPERRDAVDDGSTPPRFDNGQHILIGAYSATLALMDSVGAAADDLLWRGPLTLRYPDGRGLELPAGRPLAAFARGVLAADGWQRADKLSLLTVAAGWWVRGFRCDDQVSVQQLCRRLTPAVVQDLIEPLCVAALNTPMVEASGAVFLRLLRDVLSGGAGAADLLLPRAPLSALLPEPALRWLTTAGADCRMRHRVRHLSAAGPGWLLDDQPFDAVVLACSAGEAARLAQTLSPGWAAVAAALRHEPIVTAWLSDASLRMARPMMALAAGPRAPAQFAFDLDQLGAAPQTFAFVVSGASAWLDDQGLDGISAAIVAQARTAFPGCFAGPDPVRHVAAERRATFACTPGMARPPMVLLPGLMAAGDYIAGPYPATLEGAVRSGLEAADALVAASIRNRRHGG